MAENKLRPATAPPLDHESVETLVCHLLRLPDLFALASGVLKPEFFRHNSELHLITVWTCALKVLEQYGMEGLFTHAGQAWHLMDHEVRQYFVANPTAVPDPLQERLLNREDGLLKYTYFDLPVESTLLAFGKTMLKRFLDERYVQNPLHEAMNKSGGQLVTNLPEFLREVGERQLQIDSLDTNPVDTACPEDWSPKPLGKFSTGIPFLDAFMNGGHAGGETYGVLGAFGAGKTTMAVQLVVRGSQVQKTMEYEAKQAGKVYHPKKWYFFHYEGTKDEMRVRLMSCLCSIDKDVIEEWRFGDMSTANKLKAYEEQRWAEMIKKGEKPEGERERWDRLRTSINSCFGMIDMSGDPANPKLGQGYVPEIVSVIARDLRDSSARLGRPVEVGGVVMDYAGLLVRRYLAAKTKSDPDDYYRYLSNIGEDCRRLMAVPFKCPVWIMHQLSGQSNKRSSASRQGHADAAGSASFAENLYFCFAIGTKDAEYGSVLFTCSKARRAQLGLPPRLEIDVPISALRESDLVTDAKGQLRRKAQLKTTM